MQKKNPIEYVLPAVFGLSVFLFFWKLLPCHLHYQEQFQLFLFTKNYFLETCSRPGGFSNYSGRFFTQFYVSSPVGALLMSCFLTGIQQLFHAILRRYDRRNDQRPQNRLPDDFRSSLRLLLSFLPSLFFWYLFCDENTQAGGVIALLLTLLSTLFGTLPKSVTVRRSYLFASIPILYWIAGGTVLLSVLLLILYEWRSTSKHLLADITAVCVALSLPFVTKYCAAQYPLSRYWWGVDYLHFTNNSPRMIGYLWILILLIVIAFTFLFPLKTAKAKISRFSHSIIVFLSLLLAIYLVILKVAYPQNLSKEEIMAYDYHCRMKNWDKIIRMADRKSPAVPMTVACLNLALYKTGQMPDRMFDFYQNGPEGLLPTFQRDFMIPTVGGEPYWYLGFINTAQRFAFEAMEALPDYQKSVRSIKRLAETNLLNEYYNTASKYLGLLENTLFYSAWAKDARACLYNSDKIDAHPEWGEIRRFRTDDDFLFSKKDKDMMLGLFFQQHPDNRMAYEYLMAYALLTKDIRNFPNYFQMKKNFTYREIPKSWQEALAYIWGLSNNNMDSLPFPVNVSVKQQVMAYANIYASMESPEPALRNQFSKTYWYYFHFRKYNQSNTESQLQY